MKTILCAAVATLTLAFAPGAFAEAEGNSSPFGFRANALSTTQFIGGVPDQVADKADVSATPAYKAPAIAEQSITLNPAYAARRG